MGKLPGFGDVDAEIIRLISLVVGLVGRVYDLAPLLFENVGEELATSLAISLGILRPILLDSEKIELGGEVLGGISSELWKSIREAC